MNIVEKNINKLRYADDTTLNGRKQKELKSILMKLKEDSGKVGLKFSIQETKIMAIRPIISSQIGGETMETDLFSWAPISLQTVTAAMKSKDTCSLEEKSWPT